MVYYENPKDKVMITIDAFKRKVICNCGEHELDGCGVHTLKIWVNGNLVFANEISTRKELMGLMDSLKENILFVDSYLNDRQHDDQDVMKCDFKNGEQYGNK